MNIYLRFLWFARVYRLNQLFHGSRLIVRAIDIAVLPIWARRLEKFEAFLP